MLLVTKLLYVAPVSERNQFFTKQLSYGMLAVFLNMLEGALLARRRLLATACLSVFGERVQLDAKMNDMMT